MKLDLQAQCDKVLILKAKHSIWHQYWSKEMKERQMKIKVKGLIIVLYRARSQSMAGSRAEVKIIIKSYNSQSKIKTSSKKLSSNPSSTFTFNRTISW